VFYVLFEAREREEEINSRQGMCVGRERRGVEETKEPT